MPAPRVHRLRVPPPSGPPSSTSPTKGTTCPSSPPTSRPSGARRLGRRMDTSAAVFPPQKADFRDASGCAMTAVSVPNPSNRGCPSSLAGTTCRRDTSRISATALKSTIRCRTDPSGRFRRCVTHPGSNRLSATSPAYGCPLTKSHIRTLKSSHHADSLSLEPFPGLPIGHLRASPLLTVSAPNNSQKDNSLQKWRDSGDLADHHVLDHLDDLDGLTCRQSHSR